MNRAGAQIGGPLFSLCSLLTLTLIRLLFRTRSVGLGRPAAPRPKPRAQHPLSPSCCTGDHRHPFARVRWRPWRWTWTRQKAPTPRRRRARSRRLSSWSSTSPTIRSPRSSRRRRPLPLATTRRVSRRSAPSSLPLGRTTSPCMSRSAPCTSSVRRWAASGAPLTSRRSRQRCAATRSSRISRRQRPPR